MKYKIEFNYRYGKDYVYCNEYREDEQFVQPLNSNGKPLCTIAKTNIIAIKELHRKPAGTKFNHQNIRIYGIRIHSSKRN